MDVERTHLTPATTADLDIMAQQLQRPMRGVIAIASRCICGVPQVVATAPRLDDNTPFPTAFYLTDPALVKAASRLEAVGRMAEYQALLGQDDALAQAYQKAHDLYLRQRQQLGMLANIGEVPEIAHVSAGGMPTRVKCLHALIGHALACFSGDNPIGDMALAQLGYDRTECWCDKA